MSAVAREENVLTTEQLCKFSENGLLVIENFLNDEEISSLKATCQKIVAEINPTEHTKIVFSTTTHEQGRNEYFLNSGDKIRFFFEEDALDKDGNLKVDKHHALNKIGHSLHWHSPEFKRITFSPRIKSIAKRLGFISPAVVQSMYIFKQPKYGGEVTSHKDCTFLSTTPQSCVGFWFALEDANERNGCLWFIPGSHRTPTQRRFIRNQDENGPLTVFTAPPDPVDVSRYVPVPVRKGTLVLIHGEVDHRSEKNESDNSRQIYTFHVIERENVVWDERNWLQPTDELPFTGLYDN